MQENKRLKKYPLTINGIKWDATLWIKTTGATDGRKSYNACFFFFNTER